jgi:hypothetical protein
MGKGLQSSERDAVVRQIDADYVVVSQNGWTTLPAVVRPDCVAGPGRAGVVEHPPRARPRARHSVDVSGVDPKTIDQVFHLEWSEGSPLVAPVARHEGRDRAEVVRRRVRVRTRRPLPSSAPRPG